MKYLILSLLALASCSYSGDRFDITRFGAKGDGKTLNTQSIQDAIDQVAREGGGTVIIPPGIYLTGTVFLRSNVTLHVKAGATLLGSPDITDYKEISWGHNRDRQPYHLIVAKDVENVSIEGMGTIDGNGAFFWQEYEKDANGKMIVPRWLKPKELKVSPLIEIWQCRNVQVKDVTIKTGGGWNLHLYDSDVCKVTNVNIVNNLYSPNSDGIDITGCYDVMISGCYIKTCDDAICLKTTEDSRECRRVTVTNCILETLCVGLKMGCLESVKDMSDVTFSNCVINKSSRAIGIYVKEGAWYNRINISNITANTNAPLIFNRPLQLMVEKRTPESPMGKITNVTVSNFTCQTEGRILLTCEKGGSIENVVLRDILLNYAFIENPQPMIPGSGSSQFPKFDKHPEAGGALAAVVAENITRLVVDNLMIEWPQTDIIPLAWTYPERIENGTDRIHRFDYSKSRQAELSVLWGRNLEEGYIRSPLAQPSSKAVPAFNIQQSTIKIFQ